MSDAVALQHLANIQAELNAAIAELQPPVVVPSPPPIPPVTGKGRFDVQSFPLDPNQAALKSALAATAGKVGYYLIAGVAVVPYDDKTPLINFVTKESQVNVTLPMPPGTKHGSSADALLQIFGPNGDVWSISLDNSTDTGGFGATHILQPDPLTGVYWNEPFGSGLNSTSAGRLPFGWFSAEDVLSKNYKTLTFCAPNLALVPARYPADPAAGTNFPITVSFVPRGIPLGSTWRLPASTVIPSGLTLVEDYIAHCQLLYGEVCRDIGSTKGWYGKDYINTVGNARGWNSVTPLELSNGTLPYAHRCVTPAFVALQQTLECVTGVTP